MTAILLGLLAALCWGASAIPGAHLTRAIGTRATLPLVMLSGLVLVLPAAAIVSPPDAGARAWLFAGFSGICYVSGWMFWSLGVRGGAVSVVTPIVSTDGAVATMVSVFAFGETLSVAVAGAIGVIVTGIVVTGVKRVGRSVRFRSRDIAFALLAAVSFGLSFVAGGQAADVGVVWTLITSRLVATLVLLPLLLSGGVPRISRGLAPYLVVTAALDLGGYAAFLAAAPGDVAVVSVLASQYAVVAVIGGLLVYHERLSPLQMLGILVTLTGVALLAAAHG